MYEEFAQLDAELKGLFTEGKFDTAEEVLKQESRETVRELADYNWNIIKKYYEEERYDLLLKHLKFVAFTCFLIEYAYGIEVIDEDEFNSRMMIYDRINDAKNRGR